MRGALQPILEKMKFFNFTKKRWKTKKPNYRPISIMFQNYTK